MGLNLSVLLKKFKVKGFVGPAYAGLLGKFRLAWEEYAIRTDVVLVATQSTLKTIPGENRKEPLETRFIMNSDELEEICQKFDDAYYPGFTQNWGRTINSGEVLIVGHIDSEPVAFVWMQKGKAEGTGCYYGVFLEGDARLYRAGVMPEFRRQGIYTRFMQALLCKILESDDIQHVYIDCHNANIAAYNAHLNSGFCKIGSITVIRGLNNRRFIRWQ
jgi:RimJ/RimL family protein N-acetyltransferase